MKRCAVIVFAMLFLAACATQYRVPHPSDMPDSSIGKRIWGPESQEKIDQRFIEQGERDLQKMKGLTEQGTP